ncbi:class D sortase [Paenibacillus tarimensis]
MRKIYYSLIVLGILIMLYPKGNELYQDYKQKKLMELENSSVEEITDDNLRQAQYLQLEHLTEVFAQEASIPNEVPSEASEVSETNGSNAIAVNNEDSSAELPIATIKIPKINVSLPVLSGATTQNMKYAAAHMKETSPLGEIGNAAIAAHRARTKGRLFNRLGELDVGDEIIIKENNKEYVYTVYEVLIVEPTDVSVLNRNRKDKVLTLITCDPVINPTHRLIVHAKIFDSK